MGFRSLFDSPIVEKFIEQSCAGFVDHTLSPPGLFANDDVEYGSAAGLVYLTNNTVITDLHFAFQIENPNRVKLTIVRSFGDVRHQVAKFHLPDRSIERVHHFAISEPAQPPLRSITRFQAAQRKPLRLEQHRAALGRRIHCGPFVNLCRTSSRFILPRLFPGISSTINHRSGMASWRTLVAHHCRNDSASAFAPATRHTAAATIWPLTKSGMSKTHASEMAGWVSRMASISDGCTLKPARVISPLFLPPHP